MSIINNSPNFIFNNVNKLEWLTNGEVEVSGISSNRNSFSYYTTFSHWHSTQIFGDMNEVLLHVNPLNALKEINVEGDWFYHDPNWTGNYNSTTITDITTGETKLQNNIVKDGLVVYYNFDSNYSNKNWSTGNGTWRNLIENNYNIDIIGSSYINDNNYQPGIEFTGNDDYMNLPISIKDKLIGKDITISMWVKINEHDYDIISPKNLFDLYSDNNNRGVVSFASDNGWKGGLTNGIIEGGQLNLLYTKQQRWYEGWYNVTCLRPANGGRFETYVNGYTMSYMYRNNNPSTNGFVDSLKNISLNTNFFDDASLTEANNKWGEFQIYDRLLTHEEVQTNFLARQDKYHVYNGINDDSLEFHFDAWDFNSYRSNYWDDGVFNEGATNWYDLTGNYYIAITNFASFSTAGGGAIVFNQNEQTNGLLRNPENGDLKFVDFSDRKYTVEFVMKTYNLTSSNNVNRMGLFNGSRISNSTEFSRLDVLYHRQISFNDIRHKNNVFTHYTITQNGTPETTLYINGRHHLTDTMPDPQPNEGQSFVSIGIYGAARYFNGEWSIFRYYTRQLSDEEVAYNYNSLCYRYGLNRTDYKLNLFCYYDAYTSFHGKDYGDVLYNWEDLGDFNNYAVMVGNTYDVTEKAIVYESGKYIQSKQFRSDLTYSGTDWTFEIAIKFSSLTNGNLIAVGSGTPGELDGSTGVNIYVTSTDFYIGIYAGGWQYASHSRSYSTDTWYHFVIKKSGSVFTLFEDGNRIANLTNANTTVNYGIIGLAQSNIQNANNTITSHIRRFRWWFSVLTDFECDKLYDDYSDTYL